MNRDLIDRAELPTVRIEIPKRLDDETCRIISGLVEAFQTVIKSAPAVDAEVVQHGRWIHDINNLYGCSECMARETMSHRNTKNFCPWCGAKMDAEVE